MKTKQSIIYLFVLFLVTSFISESNSYIDSRSYRNITVFDLQTNSSSKLGTFLKDDDLYVLVFHSLTCPFNMVYDSKIDSLSKSNTADSVKFVYINSNTLENDIKNIEPNLTKFTAQKSNSYLLDKSHRLKNLFQITKNGTIIICKKEKSSGIKIFYRGPADDSPQSTIAKNDFLNLAIKRALLGKETIIDAIQTGCRITNH